MRRAAAALALLALLSSVAWTNERPRAAVPRPPAPVPSAIETSASPIPPPTVADVYAGPEDDRRAGAGRGPAVPHRGPTPAQVLERVRAVYQLAAGGLAGLRGKATNAQLKGSLSAVEAQYRDIRTRLKKPEDVDRVNLLPTALKAALTNLDRACR